MNTEELEKSLRTEFEGQMNNALTKMRADVADLQKNYESEFEKHRSQMDEAFRLLSEKLDAPFEFDHAFDESVVEHLRLARDEGAQITATAMGEAEKLGDERARIEIENLRNSINEIKANSTQASILRALVEAAGKFAPRGAFFIVKNDHFVGWKVFGNGEFVDEDTVRGMHFPVSSETLLSTAVSSLTIAHGSYADQSDNAKFLGPLSFGAPSKMCAIPLGARGRGVAVLYADGGEAENTVNIEALETLVSVAGLRIELLASATAEPVAERKSERIDEGAEVDETPEVQEMAAEEVSETPESAVEELVDVQHVEEIGESEEEVTAADETELHEVEYIGDVEVAPVEAEPAQEFEAEIPRVDEQSVQQAEVEHIAATGVALSSNNFSEEVPALEAEAYEETVQAEALPAQEFEVESPHVDVQSVQQAGVDHIAATGLASNSNNLTEDVPTVEAEAYEATQVEPEPAAEVQSDPPPVKSYRERTVDLPIEVADDEVRPHSDARRFARLLISEIRLYNEQKVIEGRESGDIYELLREAIDRSREMYEKRVQPDVAAKFDYFHYELVNNLADGDEEKLGAGYFAVKA